MQITFKPIYAISAMTGQPSDLLNGIDIAISDAPVLTGSEKQIAYANDIREDAIRDACKSAIGRVKLSVAAIAALNEQVVPMAAKLAAHTTAKSWIEAAGGSKSMLTVRALLTK